MINLKKYLIIFILFLSYNLFSQDFVIQVTLTETIMVDECHFGDEWKAYFSYGDDKAYLKEGERIILKPNQSFILRSIITEGNEKHPDYESKDNEISHKELDVGKYTFEDSLYVEDTNKGRYKCNNATFKFKYVINVTAKS